MLCSCPPRPSAAEDEGAPPTPPRGGGPGPAGDPAAPPAPQGAGGAGQSQ